MPSFKVASLATAASTTLLFASMHQAAGFGAISSLGQNSEHERITREALTDFDPNTLDQIAGVTASVIGGRKGTFGAVGAPDAPGRGLMSLAKAHCDGGDYLASPPAPDTPEYPQNEAKARRKLFECRQWIYDAIEAAVKAAAPLTTPTKRSTSINCEFNGVGEEAVIEQPKCNVLAQLGLAFHASQDFYSHTTWADQESATDPVSASNPRGLGNSGRSTWLDPRQKVDFPRGLISGCYESKPESLYCNYAGFHRVKHDYLNKDTGKFPDGEVPLGTTSRGAINGNFAKAVAAAIEDTADKWEYFKERVVEVYKADGAKIICVVQKDDFFKCP